MIDRRVAVSEAAHAVVARALGFEVQSILAVSWDFGETALRHPDHDRLRAGVDRGDPESVAWAEDGITLVLADPAVGTIIEMRPAGYLPPLPDDLDGPDDWARAFRMAEAISPPLGARATCDRLFARALELVQEHIADIATLADAIQAAGGRLGGIEIERALEAALAKQP
jgi:hypothetical protein